MLKRLRQISSGLGDDAAEKADFIDGELPSRRNPIRWLVICGVLLIAAIVIGTTTMVSNFRDHALESSKRELENTVLLLARHFDRELDDAEVPLNDLIAQIHQAGIASSQDFQRQMSTPEMHLLLKAMVGDSSKIAGFNVYDAEGVLINSSEVSVVPEVTIADRAYFEALKSSSEVAQLQIELVHSRFSGEWKTVIARKVIGQHGEFLGIVSRAIAPAKFEEFFSLVALGTDAAITMHHHDGALIARYPHVEEMIGKNFKVETTPQAAAFLSLDHGSTRLISPVDGKERLVSVRSLNRFPLSVVATTTVVSALAEWRAQTKFLVVAAGLSASVVAVILILIVRRLSSQHLSSQRRLTLEKQRLDTAVNNMTQGLTLFDQSKRLIVCNQRYIEMYGLSPDTVKPGCSFRDLIAHRNQVGSIQGDVDEHCDRILDHIARGEAIIINVADGRSIQITHRLLLDGGWVATHEEITDRLRHEKSIFQQATELARTNMWFDAALSNMAQGLVLFDADKRLLIANSRFREMYDLPEELVTPGTPFSRIRKYHDDQGIKSDLPPEELSQAKLTKQNVTLVTVDGREFSIKRAPTPDGGWVATHEDVTAQRLQEKLVAEKAAELELINARFNAALRNMSQGLCLFDPEQRVVIANARYAAIYRLTEDQVKPGTTLRQILEFRRENGTHFATDPDAYVSVNVKQANETLELADGRIISIKRQPMANGGWLTTHEDVTTEKHSEKLIAEKAAELEVMNTRFGAALRNMAQGLCMFDGQQRLVVWNDRYAELYQVPANLLKIGTPYEVIVSDRIARGVLKGETSDLAVKTMAAELAELPADSSRIDELADGRFALLTRQPMQGGGWVAIAEDITERRRAEAEIVHLARHDVLTGLANRAEFNTKLEEASKRLKRNGGTVTVMMLDLDEFKAVNDTFGHPAGDQLLVEVGRRLQSTLRETDVLARLGGDEFAIIQEGGQNQHEGAIALAFRIIGAITQPFDLNGQQANVGTSIGIALAPEHGVEPEELLKKADLALYSVKASGRNDFRVFQDKLLELAHTQQSAENELRDAIACEEFELHYQPVVDLSTRQLCGVEALIRWRHPTKGLIAPDQFIPLAEATGLIVPLGEWVLQRACADAASWPAHLKIAVNISAIQFKKGNLFDVILCTLVETGLAPERLELEITETSLLENQEAHLATIRQLKNLGISTALDDFGTGYSSVNYLTNFPFDKIKIDKSFTQGVLDRRDCAAVVSSVLALAQGLGMITTAEGIETEEQLEYMHKAGVDLAQGYLIGRPVPISQLDLNNTLLPQEMVA
jgi:diguanylate cyclase (GGDEF)-like protein